MHEVELSSGWFSGSLSSYPYARCHERPRPSSHMTIVDPVANGDGSADAAGSILDLPSPDTKRWVVRRKAVVVHAVRNGSISLQEACRRYRLSVEEFLAWQRAIDRYGIPGLRVTRLQIYRDTDEARSEEHTSELQSRRDLVCRLLLE